VLHSQSPPNCREKSKCPSFDISTSAHGSGDETIDLVDSVTRLSAYDFSFVVIAPNIFVKFDTVDETMNSGKEIS